MTCQHSEECELVQYYCTNTQVRHREYRVCDVLSFSSTVLVLLVLYCTCTIVRTTYYLYHIAVSKSRVSRDIHTVISLVALTWFHEVHEAIFVALLRRARSSLLVAWRLCVIIITKDSTDDTSMQVQCTSNVSTRSKPILGNIGATDQAWRVHQDASNTLISKQIRQAAAQLNLATAPKLVSSSSSSQQMALSAAACHWIAAS